MQIIIVTFSILLLTFILNGCATVKETYSQDGKKAYTLNCSGTARGWDKCYSAAGELCGTKGYDIMNRSSEDTSSIGGSTSGFFGAKTNERSMLVACKE
jgi:hypothetical protein